jgi:translation elongation factor EF-Tu-like GTPase
METLLMEVENAYKIYYDGRVNSPYCFRGTTYTGILKAACKRGDKVIVVDGDNKYPAVIWQVEHFNKLLEKGEVGAAVGLFFFFSYHYPKLPKADGIKIYSV